MDTANQFLGTEKIGSLMRKYAIPCIISLLVGALYNIVDQIFIANASYLGSYGNAANTVVFPLTVVALSIAVLVGDGCCAFVSISLGRSEVSKAKHSVGNAVILAVASSFMLTAVYLFFADTIIAMFGGTVNEETFHYSQEYFFCITLGIPFYMFGQAMNPIIRADGNPKFAMISTLLGAVINIILDPLFIFDFRWGTQSDLQQFYHRLKQGGRLLRAEQYGPGLSDRMVKSCHVACRMALDKAVADGLILKNPAANCKAPATHPREMSVLTGEEIQRLLIQAKEDGCYELLLLELSTGLRRGEILALQWDDLDFQTGALRVERQVQRIRGELVVSEPKTRTSSRSVILPAPLLKVLKQYRKTCISRWMFPSPKKADSPLDPAAVRKKLAAVLERAGCKRVRFHDLRHTFATNALEHGMDIKTLSAIIGHVSSATTLNVYAHVTDEMRQKAADHIDRGIAGVEPPSKPAWKKETTPTPFRAVKGKYRKPGTGCMTQINDHLWEGRYSPKVDGKRIARNVYAPTEEECEQKLAELIKEMKKELEPLRAREKAC